MTALDKAGEASMDDVLASIRRLLAEEPRLAPAPPPSFPMTPTQSVTQQNLQQVPTNLGQTPAPAAANGHGLGSIAASRSFTGSRTENSVASQKAAIAPPASHLMPAAVAQAEVAPAAALATPPDARDAPSLGPVTASRQIMSIDEVLGLADDEAATGYSPAPIATATAPAAKPAPPSKSASAETASWLFPNSSKESHAAGGGPLGAKSAAPMGRATAVPAPPISDLGSVIPSRPDFGFTATGSASETPTAMPGMPPPEAKSSPPVTPAEGVRFARALGCRSVRSRARLDAESYSTSCGTGRAPFCRDICGSTDLEHRGAS